MARALVDDLLLQALAIAVGHWSRVIVRNVGTKGANLGGLRDIVRGIARFAPTSHTSVHWGLLKKEQDVEALIQFDEKSGRYPTRWADLGPRYNQ